MSRIYQLHPRRSFAWIERRWGQKTKLGNREEKAKVSASYRHSPHRLYVAHKQRTVLTRHSPLQLAESECLVSSICQLLKMIYTLHWLPLLRQSKGATR